MKHMIIAASTLKSTAEYVVCIFASSFLPEISMGLVQTAVGVTVVFDFVIHPEDPTE